MIRLAGRHGASQHTLAWAGSALALGGACCYTRADSLPLNVLNAACKLGCELAGPAFLFECLWSLQQPLVLQMADNQDAAAALQNGGEAGDGQDEQVREEEGFLDDLDDEYDDQEDVDVQVGLHVLLCDHAELAGVACSRCAALKLWFPRSSAQAEVL